MMTIDNSGMGAYGAMDKHGGANSPLMRVGTTITSSTNISTA